METKKYPPPSKTIWILCLLLGSFIIYGGIDLNSTGYTLFGIAIILIPFERRFLSNRYRNFFS